MENEAAKREVAKIPETEFTNDLNASLNEISERMAKTGLSISVIARGTRCHWTTVANAANGIPVRFDSYRRIMVFLKKYYEESNNKYLPSDE